MNLGGSSSRMTQDSAAKRREDVDEVAARVSFTVETTVLPSFARQRFVNLGGSSSRMTQDSAAKRREDVDEVAARGLMGAKRRGGGTVQSWDKPEVDPPIGCALSRARAIGRVHRPRMTQDSAAKRRKDVDEVAPLFRAAARFEIQGRDRQALGVPFFSREAAWLLKT